MTALIAFLADLRVKGHLRATPAAVNGLFVPENQFPHLSGHEIFLVGQDEESLSQRIGFHSFGQGSIVRYLQTVSRAPAVHGKGENMRARHTQVLYLVIKGNEAAGGFAFLQYKIAVAQCKSKLSAVFHV